MGRLISIVDTYQGHSKPLVISNLAVIMSAQSGRETVIADFDFDNSSDIPVILNFQPEKTLQDLQAAFESEDNLTLKDYLGVYKPGVFFVSSENGLQSGPGAGMSCESIRKSALKLKSTFEWVLSSVNNNLDERSVSVLDSSDMVLMIMEPHLFSLNRAKVFFDRLKSIHYPVQAVRIILDKSSFKDGISRVELEKFVGCGVLAEISHDPGTVLSSINEGKPAVELSPHSQYSVSIKGISRDILREQERYLKEGAGFFSETGVFLNERNNLKGKPYPRQAESEDPVVSKEQAIAALKQKIHKRLISEFNLKALDLKGSSDLKKLQEARKLTLEKIEELMAEEGKDLSSRE